MRRGWTSGVPLRIGIRGTALRQRRLGQRLRQPVLGVLTVVKRGHLPDRSQGPIDVNRPRQRPLQSGERALLCCQFAGALILVLLFEEHLHAGEDQLLAVRAQRAKCGHHLGLGQRVHGVRAASR